MAIKFNPYRKRNNELMVYVNNTDNKVSVGLNGPYSPYSKFMTQGKRNLVDLAAKVFAENAVPFTGDIGEHKEESADCGAYTLCLTDVANVGGHKTGSDGAFLVRDGKILDCNHFYEVV